MQTTHGRKREEKAKSVLAEDSSEILLPDYKKDFPAKNKKLEDFVELEGTRSTTTFHAVCRYAEIKDGELYEYVFKQNTDGKLTSEFEAAGAAAYQLVAPHIIPATFAVYSEEKGTHGGVFSEVMPDFETLEENPLTEDDLDTQFIDDNHLSITFLEELDAEFRALQAKKHAAQRKKRYKEYKTGVKQEEKSPDEKYAENALEAFHERIQKQHNITKKNFENYRIAKGLAICSAVSDIFGEDDLHSKNFSKFGQRFDFDMSFWIFSYPFKESKLAGFRSPKPSAFRPNLKDFCNFPDIENAGFYWPTKEKSILPEALSMSKNDFSQENRKNFKKFKVVDVKEAQETKEAGKPQKKKKTNVFQYHFFATMTRYVLMGEGIYKTAFLQHMRPGWTHKPTGNSFVDVLTQYQKQRIRSIEKVLVQVPGFAEFFASEGRELMYQLKQELRALNIKYDPDEFQRKYEYLKNGTPMVLPSQLMFAPKKTAPDQQVPWAKIRNLVMTAMSKHLRSEWSVVNLVGSLFQSDTSLADILHQKAKDWKPAGLSFDENVAKVADMIEEIACELSMVFSGTFHDDLVNLKKAIEELMSINKISLAATCGIS